jgi:hypothetical protein
VTDAGGALIAILAWVATGLDRILYGASFLLAKLTSEPRRDLWPMGDVVEFPQELRPARKGSEGGITSEQGGLAVKDHGIARHDGNYP